jgi:transcriptional regulator with XRE-family HTH domain
MDDGRTDSRATIQREIIERGLRRLEVEGRADEAWQIRRPSHIDLQAPPAVRHAPTGRREAQPSSELVAAGRLFWQARRRAGMSQQRLANRAGVSQSMISRFERGLAPAMGVRHLIALAGALGRIFPFGTCPHEHECGWQPYKPSETQMSYVELWLDSILTDGSKPPRSSIDAEAAPETDISVTLGDLSVSSMDGPQS